MSSAASDRQQRTFLGHPLGLYVLFFSEMWERFSFYGMRALLVLYMLNYFRWSQEDSSKVYKWYSSLVYLTPVLGGFLADRFLGNKRAVIIGSLFMATGQFLLTFTDLGVFYTALGCMILGNGFFKPNMSTQVGRLYPPNDPRRDGAYTIFYMGINLGAFLAPLACGWLQENTEGEYHAGFAAAGVGMIFGMLVYVFGSRWVIELEQNQPGRGATADASTPAGGALSERAAEEARSAMPTINQLAPTLLAAIGVILAVGSPFLGPRDLAGKKDVWVGQGIVGWDTIVGLEIAAFCALISAWITTRTQRGMRDRVLTIYILGLFVVFFWAAFEQAGNAMNQWADKTTNRFLTRNAPDPEVAPPIKHVAQDEAKRDQPKPEVGILDRWTKMFKLKRSAREEQKASTDGLPWYEQPLNPVPTAWFQSVNALAIFLLAPLFAMLWTALGRRGISPSTPTKMAFGVLCMGLGFAVMIVASKKEDLPSTATYAAAELPPGVIANRADQLLETAAGVHGKPYHAGRLFFDADAKSFRMTGVLPDLERDRIVGDTAPADFKNALEELKTKSQAANDSSDPKAPKYPVTVTLAANPPGYDARYTGIDPEQFKLDLASRTLICNIALSDKELKTIRVAAGNPEFRDSINKLFVDSQRYRVHAHWLVWFYIFSTIGELCLSPVGLSMVSKLAPAKFATMLMGMWFLTSFFGNFVAGALGEKWGTMAPADYFVIPVVALGGAAVILFIFSRKISAMMHGVD